MHNTKKCYFIRTRLAAAAGLLPAAVFAFDQIEKIRILAMTWERDTRKCEGFSLA